MGLIHLPSPPPPPPLTVAAALGGGKVRSTTQGGGGVGGGTVFGEGGYSFPPHSLTHSLSGTEKSARLKMTVQLLSFQPLVYQLRWPPLVGPRPGRASSRLAPFRPTPRRLPSDWQMLAGAREGRLASFPDEKSTLAWMPPPPPPRPPAPAPPPPCHHRLFPESETRGSQSLVPAGCGEVGV